jgi:hypothetical protein
MRELNRRYGALPAAGLHEQEGEIVGISFRDRGELDTAAPLALLPPLMVRNWLSSRNRNS